MGANKLNLPPGFQFSPSDEELVCHFLQRKASLLPCHPDIIPDLDLYPCDPWDLNGKALWEGSKWYFYSRRTDNRITGNGYWNPVGGAEPILSRTNSSKVVGTKIYHVFYIGDQASEAIKTNWIMQELRLSDHGASSSSGRRRSRNDHYKWVVCRVYEHKSYHNNQDYHDDDDDDDDGQELSCLDEVFLSLHDDFDEICSHN